jgi:predicted Zn-dependent peptidase
MSVKNCYKETLNNGLTLVQQHIDNCERKVNITFIFDCGSAHDGNEQGRSHFGEHGVYRTSKEIAAGIESLTTAYCAYTGYDTTVFSCEIYKDKIGEVVGFLVDLFKNQSIDRFEIEKNIIKHELNLRLDNPYVNLYHLVNLSHGITNNDAAQKEYLPYLSKSVVETFMKDNYIPSKCTLIISGDSDDFEINEAIVKSKTKEWLNTNSAPNILQDLSYKPGYFHKDSSLNSTHLSLFFKGANSSNPHDVVKQSLINVLVGHGLGSVPMCDGRLCKGLTYDINTFDIIQKNYGVWGIASATEQDSVKALLKSAMTSVKAIRYLIDSPGSSNIDYAKIALKSIFNKEKTTPTAAAAEYMFYDELGITKDELINIIDKTTNEDILDFYNKILASGPSLAVYGNVGNDSYSHEIVTEMWNEISV